MTDTTEPQRTDRHWLFKPGWKGGPGRPKKVLTPEQIFEQRVKSDLRAAAKDFTAEALTTILTIMRDPGAAAQHRLQAANMVLDRAHGKPRHETTLTVDVYAQMSDADLIRCITGKDIDPAEIAEARGEGMVIEHDADE
jgi:hypothetical protein